MSCRYRFSTDVMKPALMGAIGRVYTTCEVSKQRVCVVKLGVASWVGRAVWAKLGGSCC